MIRPFYRYYDTDTNTDSIIPWYDLSTDITTPTPTASYHDTTFLQILRHRHQHHHTMIRPFYRYYDTDTDIIIPWYDLSTDITTPTPTSSYHTIMRPNKNCYGYSLQRHFQQYFSYIVAVSFIGVGNQNTRRKPPTCRNSLTNYIT